MLHPFLYQEAHIFRLTTSTLIRSIALRNAAFNYGGIVWRAALSILLIPFYVHHLPSEAWGLVAFCMALQGFLTLLDAGLAQILPRDIARAVKSDESLAHSFAVFSKFYFLLAGAVFCVGQLLVPWLAANWLKLDSISPSDMHTTLRLAFLMFFFQFWNTVHLGYWNGSQEQHLSNISQVVFATCKHGLALLLVLYWSPDAESYLVAFALGSVLEWVINRSVIVRRLGRQAKKVQRADLLKVARSTVTLSIGVLLGLLVSQLDRLALPGLVSISDYGRYAAVANLGLAFFQFQSPVLNALYPRLSVELPRGETKSLHTMVIAVLAVNVLPCLLAAAAAPWMLALWIHDQEIIRMGAHPLQLIFLAIAVNSIYQIFYQQILVFGDGKYVMWVNAINVILVAAFLYLAVPRIGIVAGGGGWLLGACVQMAAGICWSIARKPGLVKAIRNH
jgi:O-antigen/teichoic acid export membrane protein